MLVERIKDGNSTVRAGIALIFPGSNSNLHTLLKIDITLFKNDDGVNPAHIPSTCCNERKVNHMQVYAETVPELELDATI